MSAPREIDVSAMLNPFSMLWLALRCACALLLATVLLAVGYAIYYDAIRLFRMLQLAISIGIHINIELPHLIPPATVIGMLLHFLLLQRLIGALHGRRHGLATFAVLGISLVTAAGLVLAGSPAMRIAIAGEHSLPAGWVWYGAYSMLLLACAVLYHLSERQEVDEKGTRFAAACLTAENHLNSPVGLLAALVETLQRNLASISAAVILSMLAMGGENISVMALALFLGLGMALPDILSVIFLELLPDWIALSIGYVSNLLGVPDEPSFRMSVMAVSWGMAMLIPVAISAIIVRYVWRLVVRSVRASAARALERDKRGPVLLLRSFGDDGAIVRPKALWARLRRQRLRLEELIGGHISMVGPFIAIGKPGEHLPQLGAYRAYLSDDDWQEQVLAWIGQARLIVMIAGTTHWVQWELARIRDGDAISRLLILFPPCDAGGMSARLMNLHACLEGSPWADSIRGIRSDDLLAIHFEGEGGTTLLHGKSKSEAEYQLALTVALHGMLARARSAAPNELAPE